MKFPMKEAFWPVSFCVMYENKRATGAFDYISYNYSFVLKLNVFCCCLKVVNINLQLHHFMMLYTFLLLDIYRLGYFLLPGYTFFQ